MNTTFSQFNHSTLWFIVIVTISISMFVTISCKEEITPPEDKLGKRDYVWTVDTLAYPGSFQTLMQSIWASSSNNIFVVGYNDQPGPGTMYRYDGRKWTTTKFHVAEGGAVRGAVSFTAIDGYNSNDIYAVGKKIYKNFSPPPNFFDSSLIIHYDGNTWKEITIPSRREALTSLTVNQARQLWTAGRKGTIYRYDGVDWEEYQLGREFYVTSIASLTSGDAYAIGNREETTLPIDSSGVVLFKYYGTHWQRIDSVMRTPGAPPRHFGSAVWSDGTSLYSFGPNLYRYDNGLWVKLLDAPTGRISKTSDNNIFAVGDAIYHYNGIDWKEFTQFRLAGVIWFGCYTNEQEVFIIGNDYNNTPQRTLILHGKLLQHQAWNFYFFLF